MKTMEERNQWRMDHPKIDTLSTDEVFFPEVDRQGHEYEVGLRHDSELEDVPGATATTVGTIGRPRWYEYLQRGTTRVYEDDVKYVFWKKVVAEGFDENDEYYRDTQMESLIDRSQKNPDIPEVDAFADQGTRHHKVWRETWDEERKNLRYPIKNGSRRSMDQADFQDRCIVRGGRLLALYMKSAADMKGPYHLRPEVIEEWLNRDEKFPICSRDDAHTLSEAWTKMDLNLKTVQGLIFGYKDWITRERKPGLKKARRTLARYFEKMAECLPVLYADDDGQREITQGELDEIREMQDEGAHMEVGAYDDTDFNWVKGRIWYERDDEPVNLAFADNGPARDTIFSAAPLFWGAEGLEHAFLTNIRKTANLTDLMKIESNFRRRRTRYGWIPAKYAWLTPAQRTQAWNYINRRKEQLLKKVAPKLKGAVLETYLRIKNCNDPNDFEEVVARTLSHINGRSYNENFEEIRFRRPSFEERVFLKTRMNEKERALDL